MIHLSTNPVYGVIRALRGFNGGLLHVISLGVLFAIVLSIQFVLGLHNLALPGF